MNTRSLSIAGTMALALLGCRREPTGPTAEIPLGAEFTVQTAGWATRAPVPFVVRALAVAVARDSIYIMGGAAGSGLGSFVSSGVRAYSPTTNAWEWRLGLPAGRQGGDGAATINGIIYLPGGEGSASLPTRSLYAYNTGTQAWSTRAPMPTYGACGGSAVISGQLYVFSGCTRSSTNTEIDARLLHRYNPTTNTWKTLQPASVTHFRPVVATYGGKLYVVGGNSASGSPMRRVDMYDPATNSWSTRAGMPTPRVNAGGAFLGGKLYVVGGRSGTAYLNTVEAYDPVTNTWSSRPPMPTPRAALGVAAVNGAIYAMGGRNATTAALATNERFTP
jgi:N-acetylneuraminic acid mutarotase